MHGSTTRHRSHRPTVLTAVAILAVSGWTALPPRVAHAAGPTSAAVVAPARLPQLTVDATAARRSSAGGTGVLAFTVRLLRAANTDVTVHYATADATARSGRDYALTDGTATIPFGQTSTVVNVPVLATAATATTRTMTLALSAAVGARIENAVAVGTIQTDATTAPLVSIGDAAGYRMWGHDSSVTFPVTLSHATTTATTVNYATHDSTATAPTDYTAASGTLSIAAGSTSGTVSVVVPSQWNRTPANFTVTLSAPVGAGRGTTTATGSLLPGIEPDVTVSVSPTAVVVGTNARTLAVPVSLPRLARGPVTVDYHTEDGSAVAGRDYTARAGSVTIGPGAAQALISIDVAGSTLTSGEQSFTVRLTSTTVGVIVQPTATMTLEHDASAEPYWVHTAGSSSVEVGEVADVVAREGAYASHGVQFSADVRTEDGTAVAGLDYTAVSGTISQRPRGVAQVQVPVLARPRPPGVLTFTVVIAPHAPFVLAPGDDGELTVRIDEPDSFVAFGRVTDVSGAPIAGVDVGLATEGVTLHTTSDADGRYRTPAMPPADNYALFFDDTRPPEVRAPSVSLPLVIVDRPAEVDPVMQSVADVDVRVLGPDGGPLQGATVTRTGGQLPDRSVVTDATGKVTFATDGSHRVTISVAKAGLGAYPSSSLGAASGSSQTFVMGRLPFVVGYTFLLHPGCPAQADAVPANHCDDWYPTGGATVRGGGRTVTSSSYLFVLENVAIGTYDLTGSLPGAARRATSREPVTISSASDAVGVAALCFVPPQQGGTPGASPAVASGLPVPGNTFCSR